MDWISVEDRLPEKGDYSVLIAYDNGSVEDGKACCVIQMAHVEDKWPCATHWMPLPKPPKT